jgi:hypothetical protein
MSFQVSFALVTVICPQSSFKNQDTVRRFAQTEEDEKSQGEELFVLVLKLPNIETKTIF